MAVHRTDATKHNLDGFVQSQITCRLRGERATYLCLTGTYLILTFPECGTIWVVHSSFLNRLNARLWPQPWNMLKGVKGTDYGLVVAGTPCSIAIIMCLFLLLQNELTPGLTSGAVKG